MAINDYIQWGRTEKSSVWGPKVHYTVRIVQDRYNTPAVAESRLSGWGDVRERDGAYIVTMPLAKDKIFIRMLESWAEDMRLNNRLFSEVE